MSHAASLSAPAPAPAPAPAASRFHEPHPNFALMRVLGFVTRWWLLRGHFRVRAFDFPETDRARLRTAVNNATAAFLGPNHPEFGLDWMMDKEISTFVAPRMASWASHEIVASAPWFWTRNNLISNKGGDAAARYSVEWALRGHGVLLHPEGTVRWTADTIHPLFHGIADMAIEAARQSGDAIGRPVCIVPIVWKYRYTGDVTGAIRHEMSVIERCLSLERGERLSVAARFRALHEGILIKRMGAFGFDHVAVAHLDFFARQDAFRAHLVGSVASRYPVEPSDSIDRTIARLRRAILSARAHETPHARRTSELRHDLEAIDEAGRLGGFSREVYGTRTLSQEQIFESLKRHRASLMTRGVRNAMHNYLPTPYGARIAHVRVAEPFVIDRERASAGAEERSAYATWLTEQMRQRMQRTLDAINREIAAAVAPLSRANPFAERTGDQRRDVESSASNPCRIESGTRNAEP